MTTKIVKPTCDHCGDDLVLIGQTNKSGCPSCTGLIQVTVDDDGDYHTEWRARSTPEIPIQCHECPAIDDATSWVDEAAERMTSLRLCIRCLGWTDVAKEASSPSSVRVNGSAYHIAEDAPPGTFARGYGGAKFMIRFTDGREVITHNLWHQGTIPKHFRARLPDNAMFMVPCQYGNHEAKGMLMIWTHSEEDGTSIPFCGDLTCGHHIWGGGPCKATYKAYPTPEAT